MITDLISKEFGQEFTIKCVVDKDVVPILKDIKKENAIDDDIN